MSISRIVYNLMSNDIDYFDFVISFYARPSAVKLNIDKRRGSAVGQNRKVVFSKKIKKELLRPAKNGREAMRDESTNQNVETG